MASPTVIHVRAVPGVLVPVPKLRGTTAQYVGRRIDHHAIAAQEPDMERRYPLDETSNAQFFRADPNCVSVFGEIYLAIVRDRTLLPADAATAAWCGVQLKAHDPAVDAEWSRLCDAPST